MIVNRDRYRYGSWHYLTASTDPVGTLSTPGSGGLPGGGGAGGVIITGPSGDTVVQLPVGSHLFWACETFNPFIQPDTGVAKYVQFMPLATGTSNENYQLTVVGWRFYKTDLIRTTLHVANVSCTLALTGTSLPGGDHMMASSYTDSGSTPSAFVRDSVKVSFGSPVTVLLDTHGMPLLGFYANSNKARILVTML